MKRIKHNDLIHYFLRDHAELPQAYLASCRKFFKDIEQREGIKFAGRFKPEATSTKRQAPSSKPRPALMMPQLNDNRIIKEK
tara:strand:- start:83 stop:328 length:246 start_codon:yes stop_codon:yes gene_type:complete